MAESDQKIDRLLDCNVWSRDRARQTVSEFLQARAANGSVSLAFAFLAQVGSDVKK